MDCVLLAWDGEADQLHLLIEHPPKLSVSALVNAFKGTSSRGLRKARSDIATGYCDEVLWSSRCFAASTTCEKGKRYPHKQCASSST
jgi:putative transposase